MKNLTPKGIKPKKNSFLTPSKTLYLKAPYLNQLRDGRTRYLLHLTNNLYPKETVRLACGTYSLVGTIEKVSPFAVDKVPWRVLDSLGYRNHRQMSLNLSELHGGLTFDEVFVVELKIRP